MFPGNILPRVCFGVHFNFLFIYFMSHLIEYYCDVIINMSFYYIPKLYTLAII